MDSEPPRRPRRIAPDVVLVVVAMTLLTAVTVVQVLWVGFSYDPVGAAGVWYVRVVEATGDVVGWFPAAALLLLAGSLLARRRPHRR